jgi:hypothetical protein
VLAQRAVPEARVRADVERVGQGQLIELASDASGERVIDVTEEREVDV